ncbi:alpha/beta hydrolase [Salipiger sp.]|uniref:alpha/beta hydrolase n=1 Tax=Salipiger sp. TaxID=2078585 RepID=UPI003A985780
MKKPRDTPIWHRLATALLIASASFGAANAQGHEMYERPGNLNSAQIASPLAADDTIGDVLNRQDFRGFASRLLPWANRTYDESMPLRDFARLLPYHSDVRPDVVVAGLNRILALAQAGWPVFHEIYSEEERLASPTLNEAGLFFFPGRAGAPFAAIAPGGGFSYVGSVHEGFPYAMTLNDLGFNAFVVTYRTGQGREIATADMARAVDYIMTNADTLGVARDGYSTWGSSAGARMAAYIGSHGPEAFGGVTAQRPATVVMAYTGHSDVGPDEPPTYAIVGVHDGIAPPSSMRPRVDTLKRQGAEVAYRVVPDIAHGFGDGTGTTAEGWVTEAAGFWRANLPDDLATLAQPVE